MARHQLFGGPGSRAAGSESVAVIGLGRFGHALALELMEVGAEVLAVDALEEPVQRLNGLVTHVVRADATRQEVLEQLAISEFQRVVVAIGSDIQASILVTSMLIKFGVPSIWAKAVTDAHGTILDQLGVQHVIYPEKDMGKRVAHLVRGAMLDYSEIAPGFSLIKTRPPRAIVGRRLSEIQASGSLDVSVVAHHRPGDGWSCTSPDMVVEFTDTLAVVGTTRDVEAFAAQT